LLFNWNKSVVVMKLFGVILKIKIKNTKIINYM